MQEKTKPTQKNLIGKVLNQVGNTMTKECSKFTLQTFEDIYDALKESKNSKRVKRGEFVKSLSEKELVQLATTLTGFTMQMTGGFNNIMKDTYAVYNVTLKENEELVDGKPVDV